METIKIAANYRQVGFAEKVKNENFISKSIAWLNPSAEDLSINHYGIMLFALISQTCIGSIACALLLNKGLDNVWFAACLFASVGTLVSAVSQAPTRWMLRIFYAGVLINTFIILYCLL